MIFDFLIEEFERGTWVAELKSTEDLGSSVDFDFAGETWHGSVVQKTEENGLFSASVVGGAGGLFKPVTDLYYAGNTGYRNVVGSIAVAGGERVSEVAVGSVQTYMRLRGTVGQSLWTFALTYGLQWWIDRQGGVRVVQLRPSGPVALGVRVDSGPDGSITIANPENVQIGGTFDGSPIRHIRWRQSANEFTATIYPYPFHNDRSTIDYGKLHSARVDRQNSDGTVDVIAAGRFGVTNVQLLSGIPGSKIVMEPGDLVLLGFYGGDPRAPFAMSTWQGDGSKAIARIDDSVACGTLTATAGGSPVLFTYTPPGSAPQPPNASVTIGGKITSGNQRVKL